MTTLISSALMPLLRQMDPETAHRLALAGLRSGIAGCTRSDEDRTLATEALGRHFSNPIGLAAGFDKDGVALRGLAQLGFGFIEVGTVTPYPQMGNKRPRLFRLKADRALVNRLGFNNAGLVGFSARLQRHRSCNVPVGANVGLNRSGADPEIDFPALVAAVAPFVDYVVINVSTPNTPGVRELQGENRLRAILNAIAGSVPRRPPILVKIAPDLAEVDLAAIVEACVEAGAQGLIVSNTTVCRPPGLLSHSAHEKGGLSGAPLFRLSTAKLARAFLLSRGRLSLVGVGGVFTGLDVLTKIQAGASLVQLYTAFAYGGPALIPRLKIELATAMRSEGFQTIKDAIGTAADRLAGTA